VTTGSPPRVSVVIPTYNQAEFLRLALESVRAQTIDDWEAVIVDNASDDHTIDVVDSFDEPRFHLVDIRNEGVIAASRNKGIKLAQAPWIAFLDSDDLWRPEKLERCLAAAASGADLVSHPETIVRGDRVVGRTRSAPSGPLNFRRIFFGGNFLSPSAVVVRRTLLNEAGGFSENRDYVTVEDFDLWLRLANRGIRVATVGEPLAQFTLHDQSATTRADVHMNNGLRVMAHHYAALLPKRPMDRLRYRLACARLVYAAGRTHSKAGRRNIAIEHYAKAIRMCPFLLRAYVAAVVPSGR